jgi:transcriptional regulator with XRE-family HTH domain
MSKLTDTTGFGYNVRRIREAAGLSLSDLARQAGLSKSVLWAIENETKDPRLSTISRIAYTLGVSVGTLLGQDGSWNRALDALRQLQDELATMSVRAQNTVRGMLDDPEVRP